MAPVAQIVKRDGTTVAFDQQKITHAIWKAAESVGGTDLQEAEKLSGQVCAVLDVFFKEGNQPTVEQVQDVVEKVLIETGHAQTAKAYILYRAEHQRIREEQKKLMNGYTTGLPFSLNALQVVAKRYLMRNDHHDIIENPEGMYKRVADDLAHLEKEKYGKDDAFVSELSNEFYNIMASFEFTPAGRTVTNAGAPTRLIPNCIVLHPDDSMDSIFRTLHDASLLQQAGSGLGFPLHLMRPAGHKTVNSRGMASGPISFLKVYNQAFSVIKQQNRHGANMAVMRVDHPDILEFIHCKDVEGEIKNFNVSVGLTNEFMQQVRDNDSRPWMCEWKGEKMKPRRVYRDRYESVVDVKEETLTARELFQELVSSAWKTGEPGCVFLDRVNETNPLPGLGRIECCNPCGEQFLHDGDVCNLGSINLEKFVTADGKIKYDRLRHVTRLAVRLLDNVVDRIDSPVERVEKACNGNRRIGLGIMGFADMLYQLMVPYNSEEGRQVARDVMAFIQKEAEQMSEELAEEKGVFPNWDLSVYKERGVKRRNAALTNIAPTGTIAMMYDCSGGVEPYFALAYFYKGILGSADTRLHYVNKHLLRVLKERGIYTEALMDKICQEGSVQHIDEIPEDIKKVFVISHDIDAENHIRMQAAFQESLDNSISKTINFANSATKDDIIAGYLLAWELGCKGCTVYRDGSREVQVLNLGKDEKKEQNSTQELIDAVALAGERRKTSELVEASEEARKGKKEVINEGKCPECGEQIQVNEGCYTCVSCGMSACSI
jgi:ribonucleoside-diphosphate reductase alpha chain